MAMIRVQYDGYNRQFNLLEPPGSDLQDGESYLVMDFSFDSFDPDVTDETDETFIS